MSWQLGGVCGLSPAGLCRSSASLKGLEWTRRAEFLWASAQGRVFFSPCSGKGSLVEEKKRHHLFPQPSIRSSPLMSGCLQGAGSRHRKKGKELQLVLTGNSSLWLGVVVVCWKDGWGGSLQLPHIGGGETVETGRSCSDSRSLLCGIYFTGGKSSGGTLMARKKSFLILTEQLFHLRRL